MSGYPARLDGTPVTVTVGADALAVGATTLPWVDIDEVDVEGHAVRLGLADGRDVTVTHLATGRDRFLDELDEARRRARRAAMLQWSGTAPTDAFDARLVSDGTPEEGLPVRISLFADGLTAEPRTGTPVFVPLSCVREVRRDGYRITLALRGLRDVTLRHFGPRTDEFLQDLERARQQHAATTRRAYAELDPALAALPAADGWAVASAEAGVAWGPLRTAVAGHARAAEVDLLEELAGDALRLGIKVAGPEGPLPFALAPVGGRIAVEGTDTEARATFVFATDDVERLNLVLLLTNFRREAISLPQDQLGRWALAVRALEVVGWARAALVARVVHSARWEQEVRAALTG